MNREEAQFMLRAYRANAEDAQDPQFAEPLALARQDPELARWFSEEQALDAVFVRHIRAAVPVPPELKSQLLLLRATARDTPWWRRRAWFAAAASVTLLFAAGAAWWSVNRAEDARFDAFRAAMVEASADMANHMDIMGLDGSELRRWLLEHGGEAGFVLPPGLADKDIAACKIVAWEQRRVTMLCFKFGGAHADLFVVDSATLPRMPISAQPRLASVGAVSTATWQRDGKLYLLVINRPLSELKRLI